MGSDIAFFISKNSDITMAICSESGRKISDAAFDSTGTNECHIQLTTDLSKLIAPNDFFRIEITENGTIYYSNILRYMPLCDYSLIEYKCDSDEFDFSFSLNKSAKVRLPIRMHSPQLPQDEKIYTTLSGDRRVLFASINKEWEVETEYFDEKTHENIIIAMSCDTVLIDGEKVTKSDKYEIDWENYTFNECDEKIAKATFKVQKNKTIRNSNCG